MIVVKVGGSLFDHPTLGAGLRRFIESLAPADVLLVPGGGPIADAVLELDRVHGLGEEAAHWLALRALSVTGAFLEGILGDLPPQPPKRPTPQPPPCREGEPVTRSLTLAVRPDASLSCSPSLQGGGWGVGSSASSPSLQGGGWGMGVLDCFAFAREDESRAGALPHTWAVTTDSIAARAAAVFGAERLILLKSVDIPPGTQWEAAAANGWVDAHFPRIATTLSCPVEAINFRRELPSRA